MKCQWLSGRRLAKRARHVTFSQSDTSTRSLAALSHLLRLKDGGGLRSAAPELGMARNTLKAHLDAIERELGGKVITKRDGGRSMPAKLTPLGDTVADIAAAMQAQIEQGQTVNSD